MASIDPPDTWDRFSSWMIPKPYRVCHRLIKGYLKLGEHSSDIAQYRCKRVRQSRHLFTRFTSSMYPDLDHLLCPGHTCCPGRTCNL